MRSILRVKRIRAHLGATLIGGNEPLPPTFAEASADKTADRLALKHLTLPSPRGGEGFMSRRGSIVACWFKGTMNQLIGWLGFLPDPLPAGRARELFCGAHGVIVLPREAPQERRPTEFGMTERATSPLPSRRTCRREGWFDTLGLMPSRIKRSGAGFRRAAQACGALARRGNCRAGGAMGRARRR